MNCDNPNHHQGDGSPCVDNGNHNNNGNNHCGNNNASPHDHHYHINKNNFKALLLNLAYFSAHAVTIYLLITK